MDTKQQTHKRRAVPGRLHRQRGMSLIEMGIAVALLAVVTIAGMFAVRKIQFESSMTTMRQEVPASINAMVAAYANHMNTVGANTMLLSGLNVWPSDRISNRNDATVEVKGHFSGQTEMVFSNVTTDAKRLPSANQGFLYVLSDLPPDACLPVLQFVVTLPGVAQVYAGLPGTPTGTARGKVVTKDERSHLVLDMTAANTQCAGSTAKDIEILVGRI